MLRKQVHPLFPTLAEAEGNHDIARSDHLPILATVPLKGTNEIKILSHNVLGGNAGYSGLHYREGWEPDYDVSLVEELPEKTEMLAGKLYIKVNEKDGTLDYTVINPKGEEVTDTINASEMVDNGLNELAQPLTAKILQENLRSILSITNAKQHTEEYAKTKIRYKKLVDGYINAIKKHQIDVITLQEILPKDITPYLEQELKKIGWNCKIIEDDRTGLVTCFNQHKHELVHTSLDGKERVRSVTLRDKGTDDVIEIHNVWGKFADLPHWAEELYKKLLLGKKNITSIVIGDTNSRVGPTNNVKKNITTGIVPNKFNAEKDIPKDVQVPDFPDGFFYRKCGDDARIFQGEHKILDFDTGEIVEDNRKEDELDVWAEFRLLLCIDHSYETTKIIDNSSIFEYESKIAENLDENVRVRVCADSYNNRGVAIYFPGETNLLEYLKDQLKGVEGVQIRNFIPEQRANMLYPTIFVPNDKVQLLAELVQRKSCYNRYIRMIGNEKNTSNPNPDRLKKLDLLKDNCENLRDPNEPVDPQKLALLRILDLIENHNFKLGYFGGIEDNGKSYSHSAYRVKKLIEDTLVSQLRGSKYMPLSDKAYNRIFEQIGIEVGAKKQKSGILGFGSRDQSTTNLYYDILKTIPNLPTEKPKQKIEGKQEKSDMTSQPEQIKSHEKKKSDFAKLSLYSRQGTMKSLVGEMKKEPAPTNGKEEVKPRHN